MTMAGDGWNLLVVEALYAALRAGDTEAVVGFLAADLEWWFHGPPGNQHMMRVLTGEASHRVFRFKPRRVVEVGGGWVVAEGWKGENYWVHVWAVDDSVIVRFREYFNTSVTVRDLRSPEQSPAGTPVMAVGCDAQGDPTVWKSERPERLRRSLPGLVFAI